MPLELKHTSRGFGKIDFIDSYGIKCSLQHSSNVIPHIWFGVDDVDPKILVKGEGWKPAPIDPDILLHSRMHLTREQVKELLPYLHHFVNEGDIG